MEAKHAYRDDLTGLRAVAVLLVVLFHAGVRGFDAGFIGVDVFFVLSGYLITRGLAEQVENNGRVDLIAFWAARVRRLLPAATVTIAVTTVASMVVLSPLVWQTRLSEAWAATFYFANYHFGNAAQSYFGADDGESPLLHFWSLSIEEQWYVLLPLALTLVAMVGRGDRRRNSIRLMVVLVVASLIFSIAATRVPRTAMTYFSSVSRVWELGAGGLLALAGTPAVLRRFSAGARRLGGFGLIGLAMIVVSPAAIYPGALALLPVLGTVLIIDAQGGPVGPLESRPAIWLGDHSYSWYLWHWPTMVLGEGALLRWTDVTPSTSTALALAAGSLVPAAACRRFIEEPFRTSRRLRSSPTLSYASIGAVVAASVVLLVGAGETSDRRFAEPQMLAFADAAEDTPPTPSECVTVDPSKLLANCSSGANSPSAQRVLLLGDSHMANWVPAFERAGSTAGQQVISAVAPSCMVLGKGTAFDQRAWCREMRSGVLTMIDELAPDVVVLGQRTNGYLGSLVDDDGVLLPEEEQLDTWITALTDFVEDLREREIAFVLVQPTPTLAEHPLHCASIADDLETCVGSPQALRASTAVVSDAQRSALADVDGVSVFEPIDVLCADGHCPFEADGHYIWTDTHHLTAGYAESQANRVAVYLE